MKKLFLPAFTVGVLAALWCAAPAWGRCAAQRHWRLAGQGARWWSGAAHDRCQRAADFGVLPVLPSGVVYEITIGAVPEKAQVEVAGAKDGVAMQKNIEHAVGQRAAATTIRLMRMARRRWLSRSTAESARPAVVGKPRRTR